MIGRLFSLMIIEVVKNRECVVFFQGIANRIDAKRRNTYKSIPFSVSLQIFPCCFRLCTIPLGKSFCLEELFRTFDLCAAEISQTDTEFR